MADFFPGGKIKKKAQVRAIGLNGILRKPSFGNKVMQEKIEVGEKCLSAQGI